MNEYEKIKKLLQDWYLINDINAKKPTINEKFECKTYENAYDEYNVGTKNYVQHYPEDNSLYPYYLYCKSNNPHYNHLFLYNVENEKYEDITPNTEDFFHIYFYTFKNNAVQEYYENSVSHALIFNSLNFSWKFLPNYNLLLGYITNKPQFNIKMFNTNSTDFFVMCPSFDGNTFIPNEHIKLQKDNIKYLVKQL